MTFAVLLTLVLILIAVLAVGVVLTARYMYKVVGEFKQILFRLAKERK